MREELGLSVGSILNGSRYTKAGQAQYGPPGSRCKHGHPHTGWCQPASRRAVAAKPCKAIEPHDSHQARRSPLTAGHTTAPPHLRRRRSGPQTQRTTPPSLPPVAPCLRMSAGRCATAALLLRLLLRPYSSTAVKPVEGRLHGRPHAAKHSLVSAARCVPVEEQQAGGQGYCDNRGASLQPQVCQRRRLLPHHVRCSWAAKPSADVRM